jgi:hypothetical protein
MLSNLQFGKYKECRDPSSLCNRTIHSNKENAKGIIQTVAQPGFIDFGIGQPSPNIS